MSKQQITTTLKAFQKAPVKGKLRREYFSMFEKRMAYRTTKGENSEVTKGMVDRVFLKQNFKQYGQTYR
jgi:hypothetical protein